MPAIIVGAIGVKHHHAFYIGPAVLSCGLGSPFRDYRLQMRPRARLSLGLGMPLHRFGETASQVFLSHTDEDLVLSDFLVQFGVVPVQFQRQPDLLIVGNPNQAGADVCLMAILNTLE